MGRVYAIALNTYREAVRDRVLHGVLGAAIFVLCFTLALAELSLGERARVVTDLGLASISLFSVIVAVFLGSSLLYKEIERKTLYVILPKPLRRSEFLVGKFFGIVLTALVFVCVMGAIQLLLSAVQAGISPWVALGVAAGMVTLLVIALVRLEDKTAAVVPWSLLALGAGVVTCAQTNGAVVPVLGSIVLSLGEVCLLASVALVFSSFSTPFLTGALTIGVWLVGRSADAMVDLRSDVIPLEVKKLLGGLAWVVPNFNLFVPSRQVLLPTAGDLTGPLVYVAQASGYAALASFVLLVVASVIFERRDFL